MAEHNEYINYVGDTSTPFYSRGVNNNETKFEVPKLVGTQKYDHHEDSYWSYYILKNDQGPDQGWKIHVSANVKDAQELLTKLFEFLVKNEISFKFVPSRDELETKNSKYGDRAASGKFITVYPNDDQEFVELLDDLKNITDDFLPAPYILNDMQWQESHVFFRYGAFKSLRVNKDGHVIDAILDDKGNPIEDQRTPYYSQPDFVKMPKYVEENNTFANPKEFDNIKQYDLKEAIHFSNAGGVYLRRKKGADHDVIIKEGTPYAGLDANGLDGAKRVKQEFEFLKELADVPHVVSAYDSFESWNHTYFTEEVVKGITIGDFIATQFPFSNNLNPDKYAKRALQIIHQLLSLVESIHQKGVAVGDLQPSNLILNIDEDNVKIKLIDLETAHKIDDEYDPGLMTPGFMNKNAKTYGDADWFAVDKIARYLFMPIEPVQELDPEIIKQHNKNIRTKFGDEIVNELNAVDDVAAKHVDLFKRSRYYQGIIKNPKEPLTRETIPFFVEQLANGLINNFDFDFDGLIHGDIQQFTNDAQMMSVAYGGFGALMTLSRAGKLEMTDDVKKWIQKSIKKIRSFNFNFEDIGLFTGTSGIASVLYELGYQDDANDIMMKINPAKDSNDISLYSGLSGVGLAKLGFYRQSKNKVYLYAAEELADYLIHEFDNADDVSKQNIGLMNGWLGVVLFLWKLSLTNDKKAYRDKAVSMLETLINTNIQSDEQGTFVKDFSRGFKRLIPYFNSGISGLGWVLVEMVKDDPTVLTTQHKKLIDQIIKTNDTFCTYMGSFVDGFAGLLNFDIQASEFEDAKNINHKLAGLNNYLISQGEEILLPGEFGFKCSMDFSTGASGILTVLDSLMSKKTDTWIPIIQ